MGRQGATRSDRQGNSLKEGRGPGACQRQLTGRWHSDLTEAAQTLANNRYKVIVLRQLLWIAGFERKKKFTSRHFQFTRSYAT
jgi:hypothetical protein